MRQVRRSGAGAGKSHQRKPVPQVLRQQAAGECGRLRLRRRPCGSGSGRGRMLARHVAGQRTFSGRRGAGRWPTARSDGSLPSGREIARQHGRHERWGRLVKRAGAALIGESSHIHLAQPAPYIAITPRVFISCAPGRLREYRTAASEVCRRLGMTPVYASSDARSITVRRKHREDVRSADVFLLLVAHRYGTRLPWQWLSNPELEYQWAMNQPETKVLVFLANENTSWPLVDIDRGRNAEALISFVAKLKKLHQIHSMSDLTDFRAVLIRTLASVHLPHLHDEDSESGILSWGGQDWIPTPPALHAVPAYVGNAPSRAEGAA